MQNKFNKGFTLIELMIFFAIVAIIAAIAMPASMQRASSSVIGEAISDGVEVRGLRFGGWIQNTNDYPVQVERIDWVDDEKKTQ